MGILMAKKAKLKFISIEPLLDSLRLNVLDGLRYFDWIIIGRLTQFGHKYDPSKIWIDFIVQTAKKFRIPIFLKDNLKEIWGEPLIQEMPKE